MHSKTYTRLLPLLLIALMLPQFAQAKGLGLSPHRVQMAAPSFEQSAADETGAAALSGKKNIGRAVMFSLIIPGTGQLYSGSWLRALPWFAVEVAGWALFASYHGQGNDKTSEFETYAGPWQNTDRGAGNFNYDVYMLREYQVAVNEVFARTPWEGDLVEWRDLPWTDRSEHLPAPYTHDINTRDVQQYYEMIGKYYEQFGYGWNDAWDGAYSPGTQTLDNIWLAAGDDPSTSWFDGSSAMFYHYRDMRGEANDLLEKGNTMMEIVLVNHVLSALDAAFAARSYNRKMESAGLGSLDLRYDIRNRDGEWARTLTLGVPLSLTK
ncbi:MAG: hypothetical protein H6506_01435 [Calditrichaeota bacterium]|nr:hypothetical protein [Calditrichota bacterium]MCB9366448.1 hypothetical protein [Calditrichota bacterium]MCB9391294.1 hypothetical protein [Calditrichota bacterium]